MMRRTLVAVAVMALAGASPALAAAPRRVVIAFLPAAHFLRVLDADRNVAALGLLNPTQFNYNQRQELLDLTQSARVAHGEYGPGQLPTLMLTAGRLGGWSAALRRARSAPATIEPGLLAQTTGGAGYVAGPSASLDALVAADRSGRIAAVSLGPDASIEPRLRQLLLQQRLVVVDLPGGTGALDALLRGRPASELVLVLETPPATSAAAELGPRLLGIAESGLPGRGGRLTTRTTRTVGLVTALDIGPTALRWLGLKDPSAFKGQPITVTGSRDLAGLEDLQARLSVITGRRFVTIESFVLVWLTVILLAGAVADRRGLRLALRVGALAALWTPVTTLLTAAVEPSRVIETALIVGVAFLAAIATDRLAPWPRGPVLPAIAMLVAYTIDLASGSPLISRSLLGPDPILGARFYGIGNELVSALPVVLYAGVAAALPPRGANRRDAIAFLMVGLAFMAIVAAGGLGTKVGAVFTIGGGTAAAAVLLLPGRVSARRVLMVCALPLLALGALALLDLATGSGSHFVRTVLDAPSLSDEADTARRKLIGAWHVLRGGLMPIDVAAALAGATYVIRHRARVLAPVAGARAWFACLGGGLFGSLLGSFTNDSGPQLLVIGSFGLACLIAYVRGDPRLS